MNENMEEKFFLCVPVLRTLRHKFKCLYGHKEENGSNYSLMPFRVWCYKLGTPVFRQILRLIFVKPLRRHQVGWGVSVCRHWLGHSEMDSEATPLLSCCVIRVIPHQKRRSPPTPCGFITLLLHSLHGHRRAQLRISYEEPATDPGG